MAGHCASREENPIIAKKSAFCIAKTESQAEAIVSQTTVGTVT
jgi:hypothetical protein